KRAFRLVLEHRLKTGQELRLAPIHAISARGVDKLYDVLQKGKRVGRIRWIARPITTGPAVPTRLLCASAFARLPKRACATAIGVFTSCSDAKVGRSITSAHAGSIARKACSCATKPRNGRWPPSCGMIASWQPRQ